LLRVSTLNFANLPRTPEGKVDFAQDFFGREAFLTVSGQLNVEAYCQALTKVYTFGPTFRAERGIDLQSEHERYLTEKYAKKPVIVMNYPKAIKAFYLRLNDDGRTVAAMDVLAPGIGEIIGGSQREERLAVLDARMAERGIDQEHYTPTLPSPASDRERGRVREGVLCAAMEQCRMHRARRRPDRTTAFPPPRKGPP
jgi:aspartyl/asparaginyl-tRNA synthetase